MGKRIATACHSILAFWDVGLCLPQPARFVLYLCRTNDAAGPPSSRLGAAGEADWPTPSERLRCELTHILAEIFAAREKVCASSRVRDTRAYYTVHQGQKRDPIRLHDESATCLSQQTPPVPTFNLPDVGAIAWRCTSFASTFARAVLRA